MTGTVGIMEFTNRILSEVFLSAPLTLMHIKMHFNKADKCRKGFEVSPTCSCTHFLIGLLRSNQVLLNKEHN